MRRTFTALLGRERDTRRRRLVTLVLVAFGASAIVIALASANNVGGFEVDADHTTARDGLYSGNNGGDDWAQGASGNGIFIPSTAAPHTAATSCPDLRKGPHLGLDRVDAS